MAANPYETKSSDIAGSPGGDEAELEARPEEQATEGQQKRKPRKGQMSRANLVLAVLFVAAAATVYGLSFRSAPEKASAEQRLMEAQVDAAIHRLSQDSLKPRPPGPGRVTRDLLRKFYDEIVERQVPLEGLRKNPFRFVAPGDVVAMREALRLPRGAPGRGEPTTSTEDRALAIMETLRLQSVMVKPDGEEVAIISNNMVTVGQRVECFTVKKIARKSVVLTWRGKEYVLRIR